MDSRRVSLSEKIVQSLESIDQLIGVIDVGSNSIRLVVFEDKARSPDYFFNEKTICRLGEGLGETGRLNPEGRELAKEALKRFTILARRMKVQTLIGVGTAALREAEDGPAFCDEIEAETGFRIHVASGREEAQLAAHGVMLGWPAVDGVVADLGGSSLELARVKDGEVIAALSTPAGHLRMGERDSAEAQQALHALEAAVTQFTRTGGDLILVGGSWRALAKAQMARRKYPLHVLQGYVMGAEEADELCAWAEKVSPSDLKKASGSSSTRVGSIANGAIALSRLVRSLQPERIIISAFGVREGLIYARMSAEERALDPLLTTAQAMEQRSARYPGFGEELFNWLAPLVRTLPGDQQRLARAACFLNDVNWRAHPDFRATACFATVARANLTGLGHMDRLFIGAALLHRYKGAGEASKEEIAALDLLDPDIRKAAAAIGKAIRLGAMLAGSIRGMLAKSELTMSDKELTLTMNPEMTELMGVRVRQRFESLANAYDRSGRMVNSG